MGGITLHAGIVAQWFKILLLLRFWRYVIMVVSGIVVGVMTPLDSVLYTSLIVKHTEQEWF